MFVWHRDTPVAWSEALTRLAPPQPRMAHLVCWWEPGTPDDPTQRWVIYECTPEQFAPTKAAMIRHRTLCQCPKEAATVAVSVCKVCKGHRSPGFRRIKQYLEEHRCVAEPVWIIQGDRGGHQLDYSLEESEYDAARGGTGSPPEPGDFRLIPSKTFSWTFLCKTLSVEPEVVGVSASAMHPTFHGTRGR